MADRPGSARGNSGNKLGPKKASSKSSTPREKSGGSGSVKGKAVKKKTSNVEQSPLGPMASSLPSLALPPPKVETPPDSSMSNATALLESAQAALASYGPDQLKADEALLAELNTLLPRLSEAARVEKAVQQGRAALHVANYALEHRDDGAVMPKRPSLFARWASAGGGGAGGRQASSDLFEKGAATATATAPATATATAAIAAAAAAAAPPAPPPPLPPPPLFASSAVEPHSGSLTEAEVRRELALARASEQSLRTLLDGAMTDMDGLLNEIYLLKATINPPERRSRRRTRASMRGAAPLSGPKRPPSLLKAQRSSVSQLRYVTTCRRTPLLLHHLLLHLLLHRRHHHHHHLLLLLRRRLLLLRLLRLPHSLFRFPSSPSLRRYTLLLLMSPPSRHARSSSNEPDTERRTLCTSEMAGVGLTQPLLPAGGATSFAARRFRRGTQGGTQDKAAKQTQSSRMWLETLSMAKDAIEHSRATGVARVVEDPFLETGGGTPRREQGRPAGTLKKKLSKRQLKRAAVLWSRVAKMALPGRWSPRPDSAERSGRARRIRWASGAWTATGDLRPSPHSRVRFGGGGGGGGGGGRGGGGGGGRMRWNEQAHDDDCDDVPHGREMWWVCDQVGCTRCVGR